MIKQAEKQSTIKKATKNLDAVKMMREIRDKISKEIKGMSFEEEEAYLEKIIASGKKG